MMKECRILGQALLALMIVAGLSLQASAQSGSRRSPPMRSQPSFRSFPPSSAGSQRRQNPAGSQSRPGSPVVSNLALEGYCAVCIIDMKQWVRGNPQHQASYDGKTYYFPNEEIKRTFLADPGKYVPALGGDCTVCLAKMGKRMPGSVFHAAYHKGRLYLFPGADQKQMFVDNPGEFADVDLAMGGQCAVCRVEMNQEVPGDPNFAAYHDGMRYLFPSAEQLQMFHANPQKYAAAEGTLVPRPAVGPQSETSFEQPDISPDREVMTITGTSTCSGCEHGVSPIGDPDQLGLGVESADGKLYVIEQAHKLYPLVYKGRFQKQKLTVSGRVLRERDSVVWLTPSELQVTN